MNEPAPIQSGANAPTFSYRTATGEEASTADLKGQPYLVYFYPKDDTPGCTREACAIRDRWQAFEAAGLTVIGVSPDDAASHDKFRRKFRLPFALASDDPGHSIAKAFGTWGRKQFMGKKPTRGSTACPSWSARTARSATRSPG